MVLVAAIFLIEVVAEIRYVRSRFTKREAPAEH
jgi:hypothetical protein